MNNLTAIDFETDNREGKNIPISCSITEGNKAPKFYAWGHVCDNNTTREHVAGLLKKYFSSRPLLFHNAAYDIACAMKLGAPFPVVGFHDTMLLLYLLDPDGEVALKSASSDREQKELKQWVLENVHGSTAGNYMALLYNVPATIVQPYCNADTTQTRDLFKRLFPEVCKRGMRKAYEREIQLVRVLLSMQDTGLRVDVRRLKRDVPKWVKQREQTRKNLCQRLNVDPDVFNVNSGAQLADALDAAGLITQWEHTPKGNRKTSKQFIETACSDRKFARDLSVYKVLGKYIDTYALNWLETNHNEILHPTFSQVLSFDAGRKGARTGRITCRNPNLLNLPKDANSESETLLPVLRDYIIPHEGFSFIGRDYSQQEVRLLAHYENGELLQQYVQDPELDVHTYIQQLIYKQTHVLFDRHKVKTTVFGIIYGIGILKLSVELGIDQNEARMLKNAVLSVLPGVADLSKRLKQLARTGEPFATIGGRQYHCEQEKWVDGERRSFEYKMINTLIQGSAADVIKQAMLNMYQNCDAVLTLQVYDELLALADKGKEHKQMQQMKEAMECVPCDVVLLSDGKQSAKSWANMK